MAEIETRIHLSNGRALSLPSLPDQYNEDFIGGIEKAKQMDGTINLYGGGESTPVNAREVKSIEFIFHD